MTSYRNTATIEAGPAVRDHVRVRPLLAAVVLALGIALGAVAATTDITGPEAVPVAPSYEGDWKDAFLGGSTATGYEGDWKDAYLGPVDAPARTHSGDWKDLFLPEVAGR